MTEANHFESPARSILPTIQTLLSSSSSLERESRVGIECNTSHSPLGRGRARLAQKGSLRVSAMTSGTILSLSIPPTQAWNLLEVTETKPDAEPDAVDTHVCRSDYNGTAKWSLPTTPSSPTLGAGAEPGRNVNALPPRVCVMTVLLPHDMMRLGSHQSPVPSASTHGTVRSSHRLPIYCLHPCTPYPVLSLCVASSWCGGRYLDQYPCSAPTSSRNALHSHDPWSMIHGHPIERRGKLSRPHDTAPSIPIRPKTHSYWMDAISP